MSTSDEIRAAVEAAVDETNEDRPAGERIAKEPEAVLFGRGGRLDSLGLVQFLVAVEEEIGDRFDVDLTLADERAMSESRSPFRTLGTLIEYVGRRLTEESGDA